MASKRWSKPAKKKCTKTEEREVLERLRKIGQYLAWLQTRPESPEVNRQIYNSEQARERLKARYKELVGR
jgi:hypothetical protein